MQKYLDIATPLLAAGARRESRRGVYGPLFRWFTPDGRPGESAWEIADHMDVKPVEVAPPPSRTMAHIRKESMRLAAARRQQPGRHVRAVQYTMHMAGNEAPHSANIRNAERHCRTDSVYLPDGRRESRIRSVDGWEIPNWDFVAIDMNAREDVFA